MNDLVEYILDRAISYGASYADVRIEQIYTTQIVVTNDRIERVNVGVRRGMGLRVLADGAYSFVSANSLDKDLLDRLARSCVKSAKLSSLFKREKIQLAEVKCVRDDLVVPSTEKPHVVDLDFKKNIALEVSKFARAFDSRIVNSTVRLLDEYREKIIATSEGTLIRYVTPRTRIFLIVTAFEAGHISSHMDGESFVSGYEAYRKFDLEGWAKRISEKAVKMLKAEPAPSGRFTVIADPDLTGVFTHEAVGHACEGDGIVAKESILTNMLGERIGSELVTIYDDSTYPNGWGSLKYDDEGVPTEKRLLIDEGILVGYINDRYTAFKLGMKPNGGARAQDYMHPPIVRMSNTYMAPGDWSFEEMVSEIKYGVYLLGSRGGQVDTAKGTFQFNAKEAYLIENGEITKPLLDVSLSGLTLETLKNIDAVGKDFKLRSGTCGKGGQGVPAGTGGPHVRIVNAVVGGRR